MLYELKSLTKKLFFDIEVVSKTKTIDELTAEEKRIWLFRYHTKFQEKAIEEKKRYIASGMTWHINENDPNDIYLKYAPLVAEYAKVIAISFGKVVYDEKTNKYISEFETLVDINEKNLLSKIKLTFSGLAHLELSGYNIINYDIPMLVKRMAINNISIPKNINFLGKKPWEITVSDLAQDWKMGTYEFVAFETLTEALGLGNSKTGNVSGMELGYLFYNDKVTLKDIEKYVEEDVNKTIQSYLKLSY